MVEEDEREKEYSDHHGEGARIVGVGGWKETFILSVFEGTNNNLLDIVEMGVTNSSVINQELEDTVDIREFELSGEFTI